MGPPIQVAIRQARYRTDLSDVQVCALNAGMQVFGLPAENQLEYLAQDARSGDLFLLHRPRSTTDPKYLRLHVGDSGNLREAVITGASLTNIGWAPINYILNNNPDFILKPGADEFWDGKEHKKLTRWFYSFEGVKPNSSDSAESSG